MPCVVIHNVRLKIVLYVAYYLIDSYINSSITYHLQMIGCDCHDEAAADQVFRELPGDHSEHQMQFLIVFICQARSDIQSSFSSFPSQ